MECELEKSGIKIKGESPRKRGSDVRIIFVFREKSYNFAVSKRGRPTSEGSEWCGWIEIEYGFPAKLFCNKFNNIERNVYELINRILTTSSEISNVKWFYKSDF